MIRKTFACVATVDGAPELRLTFFVRVEADDIAFALPQGEPLRLSAKVPNGPVDMIPNAWNEWSRILVVPGADNGTITISVEGKKAAVTAFVTPSRDWETLTGYGFIYAAFGGRTVSPRVSIRGSLQKSETIEMHPVPSLIREFSVKKIAEGESQMKGSGLGILPDGKYLLAEYENISRTFIRAIVEGQDHPAYENRGSETMDSPAFPANDVELMKNGRTCGASAVERGRPVTWTKSGGDGIWTGRAAGFTLQYCSQALYPTRVSDVIYFDADKEQHPRIRSSSGETLYKFEKGKGIPYAAAELAAGIYAITLCDHAERGIAFWSGRFIPTQGEPRMLIKWGNRLVAGVGSFLMEVDDDRLKPIGDRDFAPSIDDAVILDDGNLLIATGADGLAVLNPQGNVIWEHTLPDSAKKTGLFGSRVAQRNGRILFMRNNQNRDNRWELFEVTPA